MIISDEALTKLQKTQLDMAVEVDRICKKYQIPYFIIAGTLLGAVRHGGTIPWDDDLDIGMVRKDYERFLQVSKEEMREGYFVQTWDSDPGYGWPFAKMRKEDTVFIEKNARHTQAHQGIFIDIFPFDNVPESPLKQKIHNLVTILYKKIILVRQGYLIWNPEDTMKKNIHLLLKGASMPFSLERLKKNYYKTMTQYNGQETTHKVNLGGSDGYARESIQSDWLFPLVEMPYDGEVLSAPKASEACLTHLYGNYMSPPPIEERVNKHEIIKLEF